ncbi:Type II secretion system protein C (plasmid) [Providencia alcalifaciens]|nr:Type II secretion system protein C [Providencia alcalifaciens]CAG9435761.1 Type II secretion system protein C [Providencia alcalifaciens]CAG9435779.1 Type II secretion system protein C [Providencia alcalifaciens]CAG9435784.1 Type II secretion system protein C [Providencia alcalifaciens]CAG9435904.1 Type II secretion system protein C [Providencia alcalifaciens]
MVTPITELNIRIIHMFSCEHVFLHHSATVLLMKNIALKMLTPNLILCVVLFMGGYKLVIIIYQLWSPDEQLNVSIPHITIPETTSSGSKTDESLQFDLFGTATSLTVNAGEGEPSSLQNVSLSSINLNIVGIVVSSKAENSIVIITKDNQQFSKGPGEKIPGYDATITSIFNNHIVINYQGKNETLFLEFDKPIKNSNSGDDLNNSEYSAKLIYQPKNIYDFANIVPVIVDKKMHGYRLTPGKDSQLFYNAGLQDNDLAVSLNGSDLRDTKQAQQIMEQLPELTEMKITVERDGQFYDVFIAVGEN